MIIKSDRDLKLHVFNIKNTYSNKYCDIYLFMNKFWEF